VLDELDEWLSEKQAAVAAGKSVRTLRAWRRKRVGPPYTYFGRTIKYRKLAFIEHFRQQKITPVRTRHGRVHNEAPS
jgi:hypothetical protein